MLVMLPISCVFTWHNQLPAILDASAVDVSSNPRNMIESSTLILAIRKEQPWVPAVFAWHVCADVGLLVTSFHSETENAVCQQGKQ